MRKTRVPDLSFAHSKPVAMFSWGLTISCIKVFKRSAGSYEPSPVADDHNMYVIEKYFDVMVVKSEFCAKGCLPPVNAKVEVPVSHTRLEKTLFCPLNGLPHLWRTQLGRGKVRREGVLSFVVEVPLLISPLYPLREGKRQADLLSTERVQMKCHECRWRQVWMVT